MTTTSKLPSYEAITTALQDCGAPFDPAEVHGLISGILTATRDLGASMNSLRDFIAPAEDVDTATADDASYQNGLAILVQLCRTTADQLADHNFDFQLLLPNDETSLTIRTESVGFWCQGFVSGLGEGRLPLDTENHSTELNDIIHDLSAIAQIDSTDVVDSEEEEVAYTELVEYVRVAVMTIYTDLMDKLNATKSAAVSKTIH